MKIISKYPLESIVSLMVFYYAAIIILIEPVRLSVKFTYILVSLVILFVIWVTSYAFRKQIDLIRDKLFYAFSSGKFDKSKLFSKIITLLSLSLILIFVISIFEFTLSIFLTQAKAVTFGFPLPIFSFSANRLLPVNLLIDIILMISITYLVGKEIMKRT